jgi:hypothetical protein
VKKAFFAILVLLLAVVSVRFFVGGPEDNWICEYGQWVKHGNPDAPKPTTGCGDEESVTSDKDADSDTNQEENVCTSQEGASMTVGKARELGEESCIGGTLESEAYCNGTWWIEFIPDEPKEGCNPACVVNVETQEAEINWRCTGLISN